MSHRESQAKPKGGRPFLSGLPGRIKDLYRDEGRAWRAHYRRYFKHAARALGLGFVAGFAYFMLWPGQERKALEFVVRALKDIALEASPPVLVLTLFYHNARASAVAVLAGVVPFLFLPILDPILNGGVLGLLVSAAKHQGLDVPRLILTKILPHGVFELAAVLYATGLGLYLSAEMRKKAQAAWQRRRAMRGGETRPQAPAFPPAPLEFLKSYPQSPAAEPSSPVRNIVRSFVLVVLPLLLIAAAIEGFVTPHLR
jgi:stage II sporulation protein M